MSENEDSVPLSKKNKREVTSFLGHELLFDYIAGQLDEERKKAVDLFLAGSKEAQQDLIKILNGVKYAEQLAETVVSQAVIDKVQEPETYLSVLLQKSKFDRWPVSVKWSIEALVVVTGIVALLILIPWDKALRLDIATPNQEVILAEVKRPTKSDAELTQEPSDRGDTPEFVDEPPVGKTPGEATQAVKKSTPVVAKAETPVQTEAKSETETSKAASEPTESKAPAPKKAAPVAAVAPATKEDQEGDEDEKITKATSGSLFRGIIKVTNAEAVSPKISEKIKALGGRKAGEVELGWKKTESSFYYHFTIPEAKYEELKTFLAEYATVEIRKENHPRVMPDGIIRLIIQVEEKKP